MDIFFHNKIRVLFNFLDNRWIWLFTVFLTSSLAIAVEGYRLGGGDTVSVTVYEQPDLSTVTQISQEDGSIAYPLLGVVKIGGLTQEAAGEKIAKLLKDRGFLKAPQVNLTVKEFLSQKIPVMGQVHKPGEYALTRENRVIDLIAQAGGVKEDAADVIILVKDENGEKVRHEIDLLPFYAGDMSQNIKLSHGDYILVPKMDTFYIRGAVKNPGSYRLNRDMTVMQALAECGGVGPRGSDKKIEVTRRNADGTTKIIDMVELTDIVQPNDVLHVKERFF